MTDYTQTKCQIFLLKKIQETTLKKLRFLARKDLTYGINGTVKNYSQ